MNTISRLVHVILNVYFVTQNCIANTPLNLITCHAGLFDVFFDFRDRLEKKYKNCSCELVIIERYICSHGFLKQQTVDLIWALCGLTFFKIFFYKFISTGMMESAK